MYVYLWLCIYLVHEGYLPYIVLGFDVCLTIQEELQGREMAPHSSTVKGGRPNLKRQRHYDVRVYYNQPCKDN